MLPAIGFIVVLFITYGLLRQNTKCHGCGGCTGSCHSSESDHDHL